MLGDCVVTNHGQRTRLTIDGKVAILRESDIMTLRQAKTPAKRIYLAVQFMYLSKQPQDNYQLYLRLAAEMLKALPKSRPYIKRIDDRVSAGDLYKALKEAKKLIAYEMDHLGGDDAAHACPKVANESAPPREREASLLL